MYRIPAMLVLATTSALAAPEAAGDPGTRAPFVREHRCAIAERLDAIHRRGPVDVSRDRFVVVAPRGQTQRYVQCIFQDRDTRMLCEAASGAYGPPGRRRLRLDAAARQALAALGYVQADPAENFARLVELGTPPDMGIAADLMLAALHDAYGARPGTVLDIEAPHGGTPGRGCGTPES
ncbi:hypothetical protein MRF4_19220 [Methylobacterium radiotolerans]|uniref:TY-Chap domain-containing protein n=1 Tax=Methylobacterium TaxID=407 RepID=UPI002F335C64